MRRRVLGISGILVLAVLFTVIETAWAQATISVFTIDSMRLHRGPSTTSDVIAQVPGGIWLTANARSADSNWVRVNYNGQVGWLYTSQLRIKGDFEVLSIADANSTPPPSGGGAPGAPGAATPVPSPTPPPDGSIVSLTLYAHTDRVNYYHLVYYSDGLKITAFYAEPKGYDKHPAVIYNRSGNRNTGGLTGLEVAPFAEVGFVAVASQLRGGMGSEGSDEFGGADEHDVINLITLLKNRPNVDPNRIAMFGASRGGMMTYLALKAQAQSGGNDIKVAATVGGLADLISWGREQPATTAGVYAELIGTTPSLNTGPFVQRSAVYWPGMIRVPILLQHGEADMTVSVEQSRRLYSQLKSIGTPVKLITYPGVDHSLSAVEAGIPAVMDWFQAYIGLPGDDFNFATHRDPIYHAMFVLKNAR